MEAISKAMPGKQNKKKTGCIVLVKGKKNIISCKSLHMSFNEMSYNYVQVS